MMRPFCYGMLKAVMFSWATLTLLRYQINYYHKLQPDFQCPQIWCLLAISEPLYIIWKNTLLYKTWFLPFFPEEKHPTTDGSATNTHFIKWVYLNQYDEARSPWVCSSTWRVDKEVKVMILSATVYFLYL